MNDRTLPTGNPETAIGVDDRGRMTYGDAAASGHVEIELPTLAGSPNATERLHAVDFGPHVAGKIESSIKRQPYLRSAQPQSPNQVLRHYIAVGKGSKLLDGGAVAHLSQLAKEFETAPHPEDYFSETLRPALLSLTPTRRR